MVKVDVLMSESLKSIIGPVQTIKRIINNRGFFQNEGFDINVFTNDNLGTSIVDTVKEQDSSTLGKVKKINRYLSLHSALYSKYKIYSLFKRSRKLINYYSNLNRTPDIIIFHSIIDCYEYIKHNRKESVKIGLFTHSDGKIFKMLISYYPKLINSGFEKSLMQIADYVMNNIDVKPCIAKIEEKNLISTYPQLKGKTCLVVNAIDDLTPKEKEEANQIKRMQSSPKYRFVCTGSITARKGQRIIVEALIKLSKDTLKNIHVSFLGDGNDKVFLEKLVVQYNLSNHVSFKGAVKNSEVYKYLAEANIFILMSNNEGLPISLIEALRSGLALISTNVSGIPELIEENINGKLINPDVHDLVPLLESLDQYDWVEMGIQSRKIFENNYVFTRMRSDYLKMLNKSIK